MMDLRVLFKSNFQATEGAMRIYIQLYTNMKILGAHQTLPLSGESPRDEQTIVLKFQDNSEEGGTVEGPGGISYKCLQIHY